MFSKQWGCEQQIIRAACGVLENGSTNITLNVTNSLLVAVTNIGRISGSSNATNSSSAGVFQVTERTESRVRLCFAEYLAHASRYVAKISLLSIVQHCQCEKESNRNLVCNAVIWFPLGTRRVIVGSP
jgi:hypothetical protein